MGHAYRCSPLSRRSSLPIILKSIDFAGRLGDDSIGTGLRIYRR
jgi:hypothetical protein